MLGVTALLVGCGGDDDDGFEDVVDADIGTFGEPTEHTCETAAAADCGDTTGCYGEQLAACATDYYLRDYAPESLPDCNPERPLTPIDRDLPVALFRGEGIRDEEVVPHAQGLQRYYEPHGLWMAADDVAKVVPMRYALSGSMDEFVRALEDAGVDPTVEEDAAALVIGRVMFAPTREFLRDHAMPAWQGVNIAVIGEIMSPELATEMALDGVVVGLGLSAALLAKTEPQEDEGLSLNTMLDLETDFTPSLFVGNDDIEQLGGSFDLVIAHELGHALGLPHVEDVGNLMEQGGSHTCRRWLSDEQVEAMGPFADSLTNPDVALRQLLALPRRVVQKLVDQGR